MSAAAGDDTTCLSASRRASRPGELGDKKFPSPLDKSIRFVDDCEVVVQDPTQPHTSPLLELAGPRAKIFFDPPNTKVGIVTCGGVSPGLNDVLRGVVHCLWYGYGVRDIVGYKYGFSGLNKEESQQVKLDPSAVKVIHRFGGTILGTSRGPQEVPKMVDFLVEQKVNVLIAIGGDGTLTGAAEIVAEVGRRGLSIGVVGIPKTIDNDIVLTDKTFGFDTAVHQAQDAIAAAHYEAKSALGGIGIVKLMGRESGFIAVEASLASGDVNLLFIPEIPFTMEKVMELVLDRIKGPSGHAVIVVAEGAGQDLLACTGQRDKSGNIKLADIGVFLTREIGSRLKELKVEHTIKYIDPSYVVRSAATTTSDSIYCNLLAHAATHAAMAGKTGVMVSRLNAQFVHVPLTSIIGKRKKVEVSSYLYQSLLHSTGMPVCLV